MRVIATAGHVDHGKSTLVRALTGVDPDRWPEERARGLTIDLGYAWTTLPGEEDLAFVDVPGHERFIANMLAGVGPAPAVMLVVAADEGWRRQSQEHLDALAALGVSDGLVVVTRSDLADPGPAVKEARTRLAGTPLEGCEAVAVSGATGEGLTTLREALARLCERMPRPDPAGRARLWVDRAFTITGAGTVVTGTLVSGTLRTGGSVGLVGADVSARTVSVRGLECLGRPVEQVSAVARVAVNLRGVAVTDVQRGDALVDDGVWHRTQAVDARLARSAGSLPEHVMVHVGTAALEARVRPLGGASVRLTWARELALEVGDRLVLRDPGRQEVLTGVTVLDIDPPRLSRRGDARRRAEQLADASAAFDPEREIERRGWMAAAELTALGGDGLIPPSDSQAHAGFVVSQSQWADWAERLRAAVADHVRARPLEAGMPVGAAAVAIGLPDRRLVEPLAQAAGLELSSGHVMVPGQASSLGPAEAGVSELERRWETAPFDAPERDDLTALALGVREVAAAARAGRLLDLGDRVVLGPSAPALAMRELSRLPQPFTTSQARQALGTTRRVVIPLLEHLDGRGWTRRIDAGHREVVSRPPAH
ncbi:selenocysteine-specific translation elongation factor [Actinomycetota bacterium]